MLLLVLILLFDWLLRPMNVIIDIFIVSIATGAIRWETHCLRC